MMYKRKVNDIAISFASVQLVGKMRINKSLT